MLIKKCNIIIQSVKIEKKTLFFRENANSEKHGCQYLVAMVNVDAHFMTEGGGAGVLKAFLVWVGFCCFVNKVLPNKFENFTFYTHLLLL